MDEKIEMFKEIEEAEIIEEISNEYDKKDSENLEQLEANFKEAIYNYVEDNPQLLASKTARKSLGIKFKPYVREYPKIQRNDLCPCGSGRKYKNCCLETDNF